MSRHRLLNEKGSVILLTLMVAAMFAIIVADLASRFVAVTKSARQYTISAENMRVADELSKIVAKAYEKGTQTSGLCSAGDTTFTQNSTTFCFPPAGPEQCVSTPYGSGSVCLDISAPKVFVQNDHDSNLQFRAIDGGNLPAIHATGSLFSKIFPEAMAGTTPYNAMPPLPTTTFANTIANANCAAAPNLCRKCGPGETNICYQLLFCPADKPGCAAAQEVKIDMMIERSVTSIGTCPSTPISWTVGASNCNGTLASTPIGSTASVVDSSGPDIGNAIFSCQTSGTWAAAPTSSSCSTIAPTPTPSSNCGTAISVVGTSTPPSSNLCADASLPAVARSSYGDTYNWICGGAPCSQSIRGCAWDGPMAAAYVFLAVGETKDLANYSSENGTLTCNAVSGATCGGTITAPVNGNCASTNLMTCIDTVFWSPNTRLECY